MEHIFDEEILLYKVFDKPIDEMVIQWAYQKLLEGFETDNLLMLAAESKPYYQPQVEKLLSEVLTELKIDFIDKDKIIKNYALLLINQVSKDTRKALANLYKLSNLYFFTEKEYLQDFRFLGYEIEDIIDLEATENSKTDIESYVRTELIKLKIELEL